MYGPRSLFAAARNTVGTPPRMHVWHQGRKVTGISEVSYRGRHVWIRGRGYVWMDGRAELEQRAREQRARWLQVNMTNTIADFARGGTSVGSLPAGSWFRLLDRHGKSTGRRLMVTDSCAELANRWHHSHLAVDQHGDEIWLDGAQRVRRVDQQPEALHSQASRIINSLHRQLKKEEGK